jgi:hypothetical protein
LEEPDRAAPNAAEAAVSARAPALLAAVLLGCCSPKQSVDRAQGIGSLTDDDVIGDVPTKGHFVRVELHGACEAAGELLAQDAEGIWLSTLKHRKPYIVRVRTREIQRVLVELYGSAGTAVGVVTTLGTISTGTHGKFLLLSGPVWLISGISSAAYEGTANDYDATGSELDQLWQFARHPPGPPPSLVATNALFVGCY